MDTIDRLKTAATQAFLSQSYRRYGAHRIGVGYKREGGRFTDTLALVFFVHAKLPAARLEPHQRIPKALRLVDPVTGDEMHAPTDVVALPPAQLQDFVPGATHRPAPGGSRIRMPSSGSAGTLGGWVWDLTDDSIVFLTNRHVIGSSIGATVNQGSSGTLPPGGTLRLGAVKRAAPLTPLSGQPPFPENQCSFADASIGSVDDSGDIGLVTPEIGFAVFATAEAALGQQVEMFGSITGYQQGEVTAFIPGHVYPIDGQDAGICDLFQIEPLEENGEVSAQGDSGKLVFLVNDDEDPNPCLGLHFAGGGTSSGNDNFGLACRIQNVFSELDLDTLCAGGFAGFLDALFGDAVGGPGASRAVALAGQDRRRPEGAAFFRGISREVEARLLETARGATVSKAVRMMRADVMHVTLASGDVRRMAAAAIGPVVAGAPTVDALFDRRLSGEDVARLGGLFDLLERDGNDRIRAATAALRRVLGKAEGQRVGEIVGG